MRKLIIPNGGMPFEGDDLTWMSDGFIQALQAAVLPFLRDGHIILDGMETTLNVDGTTTISAGWIVYNNEILQFNQQTISGGDLTEWSISRKVEYDLEGRDVFADNITKDTYEVVTAEIVFNGDGILKVSEFDNYRIEIKPELKYTIVNDDKNQLFARMVQNQIFIEGTLRELIPDPIYDSRYSIPGSFAPDVIRGFNSYRPTITGQDTTVDVCNVLIAPGGILSIFASAVVDESNPFPISIWYSIN
jgi:hypothetical protein